jgi:hypothetical protein
MCFDTPAGHFFELYCQKDLFGNGMGRLNPTP